MMIQDDQEMDLEHILDYREKESEVLFLELLYRDRMLEREAYH